MIISVQFSSIVHGLPSLSAGGTLLETLSFKGIVEVERDGVNVIKEDKRIFIPWCHVKAVTYSNEQVKPSEALPSSVKKRTN